MFLKSYWNLRYAEQDDAFNCYEWLTDFSQLQPLFSRYLTRDSEILIAGCGNSRLSVDLYDHGFPLVTSIDFSEVVISLLQDKWADRDSLDFLCMDVRNLDFPPNLFDVVIDKALLDTLMTGPEAFLNSRKMLREVFRVLKQGGIYFCISHAPPEARRNIFSSETMWKTSVVNIARSEPALVGKGNVFVYILEKI
ncbi:hypothetical protein RCL1_000932 [Eukaryota sp. TZLM3-RCL]